MGSPPSFPALQTRLYVSGVGVCGGLRMMGASGTEAPLAFFSDGDSTALEGSFTGTELSNSVAKPPLLAFRVASEGVTVPDFVLVSKGTAEKGGQGDRERKRGDSLKKRIILVSATQLPNRLRTLIQFEPKKVKAGTFQCTIHGNV